ncbi:hypothetical protein HDU83_001730 [Entophlyctis luteolus]|nr:hypothetical protein HDU83_001730 [Entophlyctis luteolus]KAJ3394080.1 hypothetical protein HDU84_000108 [Entophlyctis sp. JEL0112]
MDSDDVNNLVVGIVCVVILLVYHLWLLRVIKKTPEKTVPGLTSHGRRAWVASMMKGNKDILAVQSLRNLIMASSILGSSCVAIIFGFIAFMGTIVTHGDTLDSNGNPLGSQFGFTLDRLFGTKVMILLIIYCITFFCFAQSMRFYNHVGLVININTPAEELEDYIEKDHNAHVDEGFSSDTEASGNGRSISPALRLKGARNQSNVRLGADNNPDATSTPRTAQLPTPEQIVNHRRQRSLERRHERRRSRNIRAYELTQRIEFVAGMLNRGSFFYTLGMRGYYISFPVIAYLWGPWALLGTTLLLVCILRIVDFNLDGYDSAPHNALRINETAVDVDMDTGESSQESGKPVAGPSATLSPPTGLFREAPSHKEALKTQKTPL